MATFKVSLRQAMGTPFNVKWSNTYYVTASSDTEALAAGQQLWTNHQRAMCNAGVYCYEIYVNNMADPPGSPGALAPVPAGNQRGTIAGWEPTAALPLFNVVRVDFLTINSRPSRKFYRLGLLEGSIESGQLVAAYRDLIAEKTLDIAGLAVTVDVDGQEWYSSVVKGITSRRLGREAGVGVPPGPAFG